MILVKGWKEYAPFPYFKSFYTKGLMIFLIRTETLAEFYFKIQDVLILKTSYSSGIIHPLPSRSQKQ